MKKYSIIALAFLIGALGLNASQEPSQNKGWWGRTKDWAYSWGPKEQVRDIGRTLVKQASSTLQQELARAQQEFGRGIHMTKDELKKEAINFICCKQPLYSQCVTPLYEQELAPQVHNTSNASGDDEEDDTQEEHKKEKQAEQASPRLKPWDKLCTYLTNLANFSEQVQSHFWTRAARNSLATLLAWAGLRLCTVGHKLAFGIPVTIAVLDWLTAQSNLNSKIEEKTEQFAEFARKHRCISTEEQSETLFAPYRQPEFRNQPIPLSDAAAASSSSTTVHGPINQWSIFTSNTIKAVIKRGFINQL